MKTLQVISALLSYPQTELIAALPEMRAIVDDEGLLSADARAGLYALLDRYANTDLMDLQESYVALFDRGRALSLHIFEHVHGESRDRGQAMVDLMALYRRNGFEIASRELPDYIPLFLEYLAQRPEPEARGSLADASHILALLGARLKERDSIQHVLLDALVGLAGVPADLDAIRSSVAAEGPDRTLVDMDKIWEEEAMRFMANDCDQNQNQPSVSPVQWADRKPASTNPPAGPAR